MDCVERACVEIVLVESACAATARAERTRVERVYHLVAHLISWTAMLAHQSP